MLKLLYLINPLKSGLYRYIIRKGKHKSKGVKIYGTNKNEIRFSIKLSENANQYVSNNPEQINKAFGLSKRLRGNRDSAMLGYNTTIENGQNTLNFFLFVNDSKGGFQHKKVNGNFKPGVWYEFILTLNDNYADLEYLGNGSYISIQIECKKSKYLRVINSWFGGKEPNNKGTIVIDVLVNDLHKAK